MFLSLERTVFFGALSSGIGAELNHAMYKMGEDPRYLSMRKRYRAKKGGVVKVNTQKIDWSKADLSELGKTKGTYRIKLSGKYFTDINDALIHGTVTIEAVKGRNGCYRIYGETKNILFPFLCFLMAKKTKIILVLKKLFKTLNLKI